MREFKGSCQRCRTKTNCYIMSMYSEALVCLECKKKEEKREDYEQTRDRDVLDYLRRNNISTTDLERQIKERK